MAPPPAACQGRLDQELTTSTEAEPGSSSNTNPHQFFHQQNSRPHQAGPKLVLAVDPPPQLTSTSKIRHQLKQLS